MVYSVDIPDAETPMGLTMGLPMAPSPMNPMVLLLSTAPVLIVRVEPMVRHGPGWQRCASCLDGCCPRIDLQKIVGARMCILTIP